MTNAPFYNAATDMIDRHASEGRGGKTAFIDATGKVRYKIVGMRDYAELEAVVEVLMKEKKQADG